MIVTSYTSLVIESHRSDCVSLLQGLSTRFRRRDSTPVLPKSYRERERALLRLDTPMAGTRTAEVTDFAHVATGKIRGAA